MNAIGQEGEKSQYSPASRLEQERLSNFKEESRSAFLELLELLMREIRTLLAIPVGSALLVTMGVLVWPVKYTTTIAFTPVRAALPGGSLASFASQLGVGLIGSDPSGSPDFYASLMQTRDFLQAVVLYPYPVPKGAGQDRLTLVQLYGISGTDSGKVADEAIRKLQRKILAIRYDRQTSIVTVDVRTKWREISYEVANRIVFVIDSFNLNNRRTQAGAEQQFLRGRLDSARTEVRAAEDRMQEFLQRNRSFQSDPTLVFDHQRLSRELTLRQDVFGLLAQSYEQARLSAVRNTPSISLVQAPRPALTYDRRFLAIKALAGLAVGAMLAFLWVIGHKAVDETIDAYPVNALRIREAWRALRSRGFSLRRVDVQLRQQVVRDRP